MKGEDLLRANVNFANKAVIFNKNEPISLAKGREQMIDAESIFIYKSIKK